MNPRLCHTQYTRHHASVWAATELTLGVSTASEPSWMTGRDWSIVAEAKQRRGERKPLKEEREREKGEEEERKSRRAR